MFDWAAFPIVWATLFLHCIHGLSLEKSFNNRAGNSSSVSPLPVVLWHGMGDTAIGVKFAFRFLQKEMHGVDIESLQFGTNPGEDMKNGFFSNVNEQIDTACQKLQQLHSMNNGYNAIGLSQGAQFLRGLAQRCPLPPMKNLISLGGQHQGVFGLPHCSAPKRAWCEKIDLLLSRAAYAPWVQKRFVQAEFWHDPFREEEYKRNSIFLADINNEREVNEEYKKNLLKLENIVLVKFDEDTMVEPKESEWFGYFRPGNDTEMIALEESPLYLEDRLGLKQLNEAGKLHFLSVPGNHLQFSIKWFMENIAKPFLM